MVQKGEEGGEEVAEAEIERLPVDLLAHIFSLLSSFRDLAAGERSVPKVAARGGAVAGQQGAADLRRVEHGRRFHRPPRLDDASTVDDGLELALAGEELVVGVGGRGFMESDVDLEEGLDEAGGRHEVLGVEGMTSVVKAVGALNDGVDEGEGGVGVRLGEINLSDLVADLVSKVGSGVDGEKEEAGIGAGEVEDVGGAGEGEVAVEVGALGEKGLEADVEAVLIGDAPVEKDGHSADVNKGENLSQRLSALKVHGQGRGQLTDRRGLGP